MPVKTPDQPSVSYRAKGKRLSKDELALALKMHHDGETQVTIAQRLGVSQPAISQALARYADTTLPAKLYLQARALTMAENIVKRGRPADQVAVLKGLPGVLESERNVGITVLVGAGGNINLGVLQPGARPALSPPDIAVESESQ